MRLIFFGPPGVGKGTQAKLLAEKYGLRHLSTGELFRAAMRAGTPVGEMARAYVVKGELVPDEVAWNIIKPPLIKQKFDDFILDGFPRTVQQAEWLMALIERPSLPPPAVISLEVAAEEIIRRLSRRRMNKVTGEIYHLDFNPPPPDLPAEQLVQRKDDQPDVIAKRLVIYQSWTAPVKAYFAERKLLHEVDGVGEIKTVLRRIEHAIGALEPAADV